MTGDITMTRIDALPLTEAGFSPFGTVHALMHAPRTPSPDTVVRSQGDGWKDAYTRLPLINTNGSLGLTLGEGGDFTTRRMERHVNTQEALFCAAEPVVLAVAPPTSGEKPLAADIRAFLIEPGMVVVLHEGTWHDACRGIDGPAYYYWMATTGSGATWVEVDGGPVHVRTKRRNTADV